MAATLKVTGTGVITTMPVSISMITWTPVAAGDQCVIVDGQGRDVFRAQASSANADVSLSMGERTVPYWGLNFTTLSSGTVTIYYR